MKPINRYAVMLMAIQSGEISPVKDQCYLPLFRLTLCFIQLVRTSPDHFSCRYSDYLSLLQT